MVSQDSMSSSGLLEHDTEIRKGKTPIHMKGRKKPTQAAHDITCLWDNPSFGRLRGRITFEAMLGMPHFQKKCSIKTELKKLNPNKSMKHLEERKTVGCGGTHL